MKTEQWCLDVVCAHPVLLWVWCVLLAGTIFWTIMLHILSKGFLAAPAPQYPEGKPFSILTLELPFSHSRFRELLERLPAKSLKPVRWSLWADFIFMVFAYPLLVCSAWYLLRNSWPELVLAGEPVPVAALLQWCIRLSFVAWLLDMAENILIFSCLHKVSFLKSRTLLLVSLIKWCCAILVVGCLMMVALKA